eukprot:scaffold47878_cov59-Phaeocystis_antarctica.AAC.1
MKINMNAARDGWGELSWNFLAKRQVSTERTGSRVVYCKFHQTLTTSTDRPKPPVDARAARARKGP